jgi:DNA-binding NarL/FixJ family response regulator
MNHSNFRVLVVEDDLSWQQILSEILSDSGLEVEVSSNFEEAVNSLKAQPHRLAVVDLSLSPNDHNNYDGLRVLDTIRILDPDCRTILLTGFATVELAVTALSEYGAFTFLRKENFHRGQFREIVNRAMASAPQTFHSNSPANIKTESTTAPNLSILQPQPISIIGRAIVVEDDAGWRSIIEELLVDSGYSVCTCRSFGEAISYLRREKFSVAIVDLSLNGTFTYSDGQKFIGDSLQGYQLLSTTRASGLPTIVVSGVASPEEIKRAYSEQSIFAYLEKQSFDRASFRRLLEEVRISDTFKSELSILTGREREVLDLLAQGMTNKDIADKLFITINTVKRHLKAIFEKLDVHTRSAAAAKALGER